MKRSIFTGHVIIVGDEHNKRNFQKEVAFVGSKSYLRVLSWIGNLDLMTHQVFLYNREELYPGIQGKVLALGNNAAKACEKLGYKYFQLPHPSGLNRQLNDVNFEKKILKEAYKWIRE